MLKTPDSLQKAEAFYKDKMKEDGWKIENTMNMPQQTMLLGKKKDRSLSVMIVKESDATNVTLTVEKQK